MVSDVFCADTGECNEPLVRALKGRELDALRDVYAVLAESYLLHRAGQGIVAEHKFDSDYEELSTRAEQRISDSARCSTIRFWETSCPLYRGTAAGRTMPFGLGVQVNDLICEPVPS